MWFPNFWESVGNAVVAIATVLSGIREECYSDIGCFSNASPFNNAVGKVPSDPANMNVKFLLFTRSNRLAPQTLTINPEVLTSSNYDRNRKTKFIIHGFRDNSGGWVRDMATAILDKTKILHEDVNVIAVDWEGGAFLTDYSQAAANTRVVGALVAQLIKTLGADYNLRMEDVHLIGHSLGAHISGYVGSTIPRIGRISGLDPAGLYFEQEDIRVRLDPEDALFVDVIHTDGESITNLGFGSRISIGDVDFYPNGGKNQPGCAWGKRHIDSMFKNGFSEITDHVGCSHNRAPRLFTESISISCIFKASQCINYFFYWWGWCTCARNNCANMGYHVDTSIAHGDYYLTTNATEPYCNGVMYV